VFSKLRPRFMTSETDCAFLTASLPSRSFLLEAPLFVVDKRYMRPSSTEVIQEAQHRLALSTQNSSDSSSSRTKCNLIKGADKAVYATSDTRTKTMRRTCRIISKHKRQALMMRSLGENVGMRTGRFVKHRNAHMQAIVAKLGCG
jgi:hypothetical protein